MRTTLALLVITAAACGADAPNASVSGVFPASGFTGRQVRVEVTGDVTNFAAGSTLDFGAGVTVGTVNVASPTSLFAELTIADTAALGMRDVNVTSGADHYTLTQAFEIDTPLVVETSGTFAQGSVATVTVRNLDFSAPFDSTCGFSFLGQCFVYSNIDMTLGTGTNVVVQFVDDYHISAQVFMDIDAAGGPLSIASGATTLTTSNLGADVPIAARTPVTLTTTAMNGTITTPGGSVLAQFTTTAGTLGRAIAATDPSTASTVYLLPASGHFADQIARVDTADAAGNLQANGLAAGGASFIAIYVDDGAMSPVSLKLSPLTLANTLLENDTGAGNNTSGTAQVAAGLPLLFNTATLSAETDQDWVRIQVTANDVGKHIHVVTAGGDPQTDTVVDAFAANGTTSLGSSADGTFHEDFISNALAAGNVGNVFIEISASQGFFKPAHNTYIAAIWIE